MNFWWIFAIIYLIGWVTYSQLIKYATKRVKDFTAMTVLVGIFGGLVPLALLPFSEITFPTSIWPWLMILCSCVCYAIADWTATAARSKLEVSTASILNQIMPVLTMLFGIVVFREGVTWLKLLGAGLIVLSNIWVLYQGKKIRWNKYIGWMILGNILMAAATVIDIGVSGNFNLPFYITITIFMPTILLMVFGRVGVHKMTREFKKGKRWAIALAGIGWGAAILASLKAYQLAAVSTVAPILATSTIVNVLVAYRLFGERKDFTKKIIATIVIVVGVALVNLG